METRLYNYKEQARRAYEVMRQYERYARLIGCRVEGETIVLDRPGQQELLFNKWYRLNRGAGISYVHDTLEAAHGPW